MIVAMAATFAVSGSTSAEAGERTAFREASPLVRHSQPVRNGSTVTLRATLHTSNGGLSNQIVKFYVQVNGRWVYVGQNRTDRAGHVSISPRVTLPGPLGRDGVVLRWAPVFEQTSRHNGADARNGIMGTGFILTP